MRDFFIPAFAAYCFAEIFIMIDSARKKNKLMLISNAVILVFYCIFLYVKYLYSLNIPNYILLLSIIASFIHTFFGEYLNFYNQSIVFDRYLHGYGSFSIALLSYFLIANLIGSGSKLFNAVFIMFLGVGLGSVFEVFEFAMDAMQKNKHAKGLKRY